MELIKAILLFNTHLLMYVWGREAMKRTFKKNWNTKSDLKEL